MSDEKRLCLGPANFREGEFRGYSIGKHHLLVACVGGKMKALDDWCNHAGCLLSGGYLEANMVVCPCHEVGFDLDTGKNVTSPGVAGDQTAYPTQVDDGQLIVVGFPTE